MVSYAQEHVPYYRETLDRLGLTPGDFATADDLARLPLIEREQLQRDPEYFVSTERPIERYIKLATDGTTGMPVTVYHDPLALFRGATLSERREALLFKLAGKRLRRRRVFIGSPEGTLGRTSRAVRRRSVIPAKLRYTDLWLSREDPPARTLERISEFRADTLRCYGSVAQSLFLEADRSSRPFRAPKVVVYGGDSMSEPIRRLIAEDFGAALISEYGAGEAQQIALECEEHTGLHLNSDFYPVRIVDPEERELADGELGEVVVSNLMNRGTVLLNYRLGDLAAKLQQPCPCGRSLPLLSFPEGRTDDWIETAAGQRVHGQEVRGLLLADDRWILAFQIEQLAYFRFAVSAVVTEGTDRDALRGRIQERFADRFGDRTTTEVSFAESLARTPGGKVRVVKSRLPAAPPAAS
jgi:phenylacetate-CoA ligase